MDYRALIAPFIDFRRAKVKTDKTIRDDTRTLYESIDFFEQGNFDAPNEEYFSALEAHFLQRFKQSTTDSKISLTRKFFTWTQKGDAHMQEDIQITTPEQSDGLTESIDASNEEAPKTDFTEEHEETLTDKSEASPEGEKAPSNDTVDAHNSEERAANEPILPQNEEEGLDADKKKKSSKQSKKQIKLTVYPDKALEADIRLLAGVAGIPVSKFILKLIQQEVNNRMEDLKILRPMRDKNT